MCAQGMGVAVLATHAAFSMRVFTEPIALPKGLVSDQDGEKKVALVVVRGELELCSAAGTRVNIGPGRALITQSAEDLINTSLSTHNASIMPAILRPGGTMRIVATPCVVSVLSLEIISAESMVSDPNP